MDVDREGRSRRSFLGVVGKTAAAAVGISLLPKVGGVAFGATGSPPVTKDGGTGNRQPQSRGDTITAITYSCCINTSRCATYTCGSKANYYCTSNNACAPSYCTGCQTYRGSCYNFQSGC